MRQGAVVVWCSYVLAGEERASGQETQHNVPSQRKPGLAMWIPFCVNGCWRLWDVGNYGSTQCCPSVPVAKARQAEKLIDHHSLPALDLESLSTSQEVPVLCLERK